MAEQHISVDKFLKEWTPYCRINKKVKTLPGGVRGRIISSEDQEINVNSMRNYLSQLGISQIRIFDERPGTSGEGDLTYNLNPIGKVKELLLMPPRGGRSEEFEMIFILPNTPQPSHYRTLCPGTEGTHIYFAKRGRRFVITRDRLVWGVVWLLL